MRYPVLLCLALVGCGAAQVERCRLDALRVLPLDPLQVTPYDAIDLVNRINACEAPPPPLSPLVVTDAGF